jgi:hypothetical protein
MRHITRLLYKTVEEYSDCAQLLASTQSIVLILHPAGGELGRVEGLAVLGALAAMHRGLDHYMGDTAVDHARAIALSTVNKCLHRGDPGLKAQVLVEAQRWLMHLCGSLCGVTEVRDLAVMDLPGVRCGLPLASHVVFCG